MLGTRLVTGLSMVGALLLVLCLDEWLAPWFPFWFVLAGLGLGSASMELVGLLQQTEVRAAGDTGIAGGRALGGGKRAPHLAAGGVNPSRLGGRGGHGA